MTASRDALQYVRNNLIFNATAGARSGEKKVVFVLTYGRSLHRISSVQAKQMKRAGVIIFALGVTNSITEREQLLVIATSFFHAFHVNNYAVLYRVTQILQESKWMIPAID